MKAPHCSEDEFLAAVRETCEPGCIKFWWLGQSGYLFKHAGRHLLIDPYLSDSLTKKYANTDKPHVRLMSRLVAPEKLNFIDVVSSSHTHTDHLDPETLGPLFSVNPHLKLVAPEAHRAEAAARAGIDPANIVGMDENSIVEVRGFRFTGIPAAHNTIEHDESGRCKFLGYIIDAGPFRIYHSGDTLLYEGLAERLCKFHKIDIMLLPINGDKPERRVAGNMNAVEAATLAKRIAPACVLPCHYDMFEFNTGSSDEFASACKRLGVPHYFIASVGQTLHHREHSH